MDGDTLLGSPPRFSRVFPLPGFAPSPRPLFGVPPPLPSVHYPPPLPPVHAPPPLLPLLPDSPWGVCTGASPRLSPSAWPVPGSPMALGHSGLGSSLLDETVEAVDVTVPAVLSPPPPSPSWSSSPLLAGDGRVRGVRLRRLPAQPLPSQPPPPAPRTVGCYVRSSCPLCNQRLRKIDSDTDGQYCSRCLADIFPFNAISSDRKFKEAINGFSIDQRHLSKAESMRFNPLDETVREVLTDLNETIGGCVASIMMRIGFVRW